MYRHLTSQQGLQCLESVKKLLYVVSLHSNDGASMLQGMAQSLQSACWLWKLRMIKSPQQNVLVDKCFLLGAWQRYIVRKSASVTANASATIASLSVCSAGKGPLRLPLLPWHAMAC